MTTIVHIMLDLETWGTEPGCDIRSIGACVFDPLTGAVNTIDGEEHPSHFYIATMNGLVDWQNSTHGKPLVEYGYDAGNKLCRKYPLTRDPKTVQWWSEQSDEAQAAFTNPVDLRQALKRFDEWLTDLSPRTTADRQSPHIRLWSHGGAAQSSFDIAILYAAYKAVGLPVPWHYRAPRDTRTAFDMAGVDDHSAWLRQFDTGTFHHALHDAISQAKAVCAAWQHAGRASRWSIVAQADGPSLRKAAIEATRRYDDWTNQNETAFTGWGDMVVPPEATAMRVNSGRALSILLGNDGD